MTRKSPVNKFALVCNYLPRQCGIATFSHDVSEAITAEYPDTECLVVPINDRPEGYDYPPEVRFEIAEQDADSYRRAAEYLNFSNAEVACIQHEFGIFGGPSGSHILTFLRHLKIPSVVHLHTILEKPTADQRRVMREMDRLAGRFVVMSERGRDMLQRIYGIAEDRIDLIPHGIPDTPFVDPSFYKDDFGVEGKQVILTFGLLSPGKGIENVIRALPEVVKQVPNVVYIVLGATHPNLLREQGEAYRLSLERLAADLGVEKHLVFYNRFVSLDELKEFLGAADVYVTPYLNAEQITSGTLAYAFGCGKAVVSTPYWHAEELLADGRGVLVPFRDPEAMARELTALLTDDVRRNAMRKQAYLLGREMVWSHVAHQFMASFRRARSSSAARLARRYELRTLETQPHGLPDVKLDHVMRLSDDTGILQHATHAVPNYHEGYCTDDNARALLLATLLEETGDGGNGLHARADRYAAFLNYAFDPATGRFRNFMGFDRHWIDEVASEDAHGRALWALGTCVGRTRNARLERWAAELFPRALPGIESTRSPRAWAFAILGIHEYLHRLEGARHALQMSRNLAGRLAELYEKTATDEWNWFEPVVSYANARLPHALLLAGRHGQDERLIEIGLKSLRWLVKLQTAENGHFRPIGSEGFYPRGGVRARYDQQPIEASATVSACIEAYAVTKDAEWLDEARRAFDWFLGRNDLGAPLYDPSTGGCYDGLHIDRVNRNQGAESTLAYLTALQELRLLTRSLESFDEPTEPVELDAVEVSEAETSEAPLAV